MTAMSFIQWHNCFQANIRCPSWRRIQTRLELHFALLPNILESLAEEAESNGIDSTPCWDLLGELHPLIDDFFKTGDRQDEFLALESDGPITPEQSRNLSPRIFEYLNSVWNLSNRVSKQSKGPTEVYAPGVEAKLDELRRVAPAREEQDGPVFGDRWRYKGKVFSLEPAPWKLCYYLWCCGESIDEKSSDYSEQFLEAFFGDRATDFFYDSEEFEQVRRAQKKANRAFTDADCPLHVFVKKYSAGFEMKPI